MIGTNYYHMRLLIRHVYFKHLFRKFEANVFKILYLQQFSGFAVIR